MVDGDLGLFMQKQAQAHAAQPSKTCQSEGHGRIVEMAFTPHRAEEHDHAEVR